MTPDQQAPKTYVRLSPMNEVGPFVDLRARGLVREPARGKRAGTEYRQQLRSLEPVSDLVAEQRR